MRDKVRLFTAVYVPKDDALSYPFLMRRTPYSAAPYGTDRYPTNQMAPFDDLARAGYIFVFQDGRGRLMSEGSFLEYSPRRDLRTPKSDVDESTDTYDTVEWLLAHISNNNGRVGILGLSYDGFYVAASITDTHPAIKAADIEAMGDWNYHHGAFMLADNFEFYIDFRPDNKPALYDPELEPAPRFHYWTQDSYEFFLHAEPLARLNGLYFDRNPNPLWTDQVRHNTIDAFWKERDLLSHLTNIHCAVLNVGGWFDQYVPQGPIEFHRTIGKSNPGVFNGLVVGPWSHGGDWYSDGRRLGDVDFGSETAIQFRTSIRLPFFEYYLKGRGTKLPEVQVFETGTNLWRRYPAWPPPGTRERTLYFQEHGGLAFDAPPGTSAFDEYVSDPAKPVPLVGYTPAPPARATPPEYMTGDQRFASRRPDVVVYQTEPLQEDLTVTGPVSAKLFVSTSGTDSDWVVKLIDVYPLVAPDATPADDASSRELSHPRAAMAGYQQLVRGEALRGKFRHSREHAEPFSPNQVEPVAFAMADVNHTFRRGHRVMVQIQSTWFPLVDLNPQVFINIPDAKPEDFHSATQRIYRSSAMASGLNLQVLELPGKAK